MAHIKTHISILTVMYDYLRQSCIELLGQIEREMRISLKGKSPGLVVMGGDSRSKGHGFESWRCILDGHDIFSHCFVVKIVSFV